jgi:lysophospholipase L1-like esterase
VVFTIPTDAPRGARTIYFTALESRYFVTASFTVSDKKPIPLPEIDYFALGDSIASGHGLKDKGGHCRQSDKAYPYQVRDYLGLQFKVNFPPEYHLACSGATAREPSPEVLKQQHRFKWFKNQVIEVLNHLNKNKQQGIERRTLVSITIGANDFDFAPTPAGFELYWRALTGHDDEFLDWVSVRRDRTEKALMEMDELNTLLSYPNVAVVFTRYHNPLPDKSWVYLGFEQAHAAPFRALKLPLPAESCGHIFNVLTCQNRGQNMFDELNDIQNRVVLAMFEKWGTDRIGITPIAYTNFEGHKGPVPSFDPPLSGCGLDGPSYTETWVQYFNDPDANAFPHLGGDCFHPNEMGAKKFAEGIIKAVEKLKLGR